MKQVEYTVQNDAWIDGKRRVKGDTVLLTEKAAKYYTEPYSRTLKPAKAKKSAPAKVEPKVPAKSAEASVEK